MERDFSEKWERNPEKKDPGVSESEVEGNGVVETKISEGEKVEAGVSKLSEDKSDNLEEEREIS
jgi:hypothetical protein